jgi:hypothetical protein
MRSTPGHYRTSPRSQSFAFESTATSHRAPPPPRSAPPSPGLHSTARAPVRPELSSPRSPVRAGVSPRWTEHTQPVHGDVDPVHGLIRWKIICYSDYSEILQRGPFTFVKSTRGPDFANFALRPLGFSKINPQSMNFRLGPKFEK